MTVATEFTYARAGGAFPGLGHALPILKNPRKFVGSLPGQGDLVQIRVGTWRGYVVCHPALVRQILLNDKIFDKGGPIIDRAQEFAGDGILTCPYSQHRRRRRIVQPALDRVHLEGYAGVMADCIDHVTGSWKDGEDISPKDEAFSITTRVAAATLFGTAVDAQEIARVEHAMQVVLADGYRIMLLPGALKRLPLRRNRRYAQAIGYLREKVQHIIAAYRSGSLGNVDFLTRILNAAEGTDSTLTDDEAFNEVLGLLVASVETTANAIAWSCLMLARHPHLQRELHTEADMTLGSRPARWADLPNLAAAGRFLTESLRMYPPAWVSSRIVTKETTLAGTPLPIGATVIYSPYLLHHREDLFSSPETFDPSRWASTGSSQRPRGSFLPFSTGARQCIGNDFGFTEAHLTLATIASRWRFDALDEAVDLTPLTQISLNPPPIRLKARRYSSAAT